MVFPYHRNAGESLLILADTARFVYDAVTGGMRQANNRYARLRGTYYPGGAPRTDTTVFGLYSSPLTDGTTRGQSYAYERRIAYGLELQASALRTSSRNKWVGASPPQMATPRCSSYAAL